MKKYEYLRVMVKALDGTTYSNPLKLSEAHFISDIAKDCDHIFLVRRVTCSPEEYKRIFG